MTYILIFAMVLKKHRTDIQYILSANMTHICLPSLQKKKKKRHPSEWCHAGHFLYTLALTQGPPDLVQLVHVRLARPQRDPWQQLSKHAADGPDVHRRAVLGVSHQQLGGPVPACGHVVSVVVTWSSWGQSGQYGVSRMRWNTWCIQMYSFFFSINGKKTCVCGFCANRYNTFLWCPVWIVEGKMAKFTLYLINNFFFVFISF